MYPMNIGHKYQFFKVQPEQNDLCETITWAQYSIILWGCAKNKLYPSYMVFGNTMVSRHFRIIMQVFLDANSWDGKFVKW